MSTMLAPGQNLSITRQNPHSQEVTVDFSWDAPRGTELDSSAFALTAQGRVRNDDDFIFYNQPDLAGGGIRRAPEGRRFTVDLQRLPADVAKVAFTLTIHEGQARGQSFADLHRIRADILDARTETAIAAFPLETGGMRETALIVAELYRHNAEWKVRAVGQGFVGGLGPLAESYGVKLDEPASQAAPPPPPAPAPKPAAPPISLNKITLEKKGQSISLEKKAGFGEIVVNLNWSRSTGGQKGLLGGLFGGGGGGTDLDLGCLFELTDGVKGAVQALGNSFGSLESPPYIQLMGDDRTGDSTAGEFLHINGRYWDRIRRILIYAFIYQGAPNWAAADGVVTVKTPGQPTLEVRLDNHRRDCGMCAIALLENDGGNIRVSKQVEYFNGHRNLDQGYSWGLRWAAGSKD